MVVEDSGHLGLGPAMCEPHSMLADEAGFPSVVARCAGTLGTSDETEARAILDQLATTLGAQLREVSIENRTFTCDAKLPNWTQAEAYFEVPGRLAPICDGRLSMTPPEQGVERWCFEVGVARSSLRGLKTLSLAVFAVHLTTCESGLPSL